MKIGMLIDGWEPVYGGGQIHVDELSKRLIKNHDCKIDLFVRKLKDKSGVKYNENEELLSGNLNLIRVGPTTTFFNTFGRIFSLIMTTYVLFNYARKEKYDIIHAHAYVSGLPAKIVSKLLNIPIVYTVHGTMLLDSGKKSLFYYIENFLVNKINYDLEISVSSNIYNYRNKNNIKIIPNGVDILKYDLISDEGKYKGFHFIWVGRFDWQKGLDYLIEGINLIDREVLIDKQFVLHLVGDGEEKKNIEEKITLYGLNQIIICEGKIFGEQLIKEYKKNHVFILPSLAEGQPLTILEAFASKIGVIATNVGDNRYFINKENGFLITPGNSEEIKDIITKVLNLDHKYLETLGMNGYNYIKNEFTWDIMVDKTYNEYKKIRPKY